MKLRNKKTGEIAEQVWWDNEVGELCINGNKMSFYNSLSEINEDWEDYEEPKEYWYICSTRSYEITRVIIDEGTDFGKVQKDKEIGNYFETIEEAEKAVEKLKAITRLGKCGFKFEGYDDRDRANGGDIVIYVHIDIPNNNLLEEAQPAMLKDLDLLFGGEK